MTLASSSRASARLGAAAEKLESVAASHAAGAEDLIQQGAIQLQSCVDALRKADRDTATAAQHLEAETASARQAIATLQEEHAKELAEVRRTAAAEKAELKALQAEMELL